MIQRFPSALIRNAIVTMLLAELLCGNSLLCVAVSAEPAVFASDLPADGIYPPGRKLAFAGYSGDPARNLANGFTLAGPVYGDEAVLAAQNRSASCVAKWASCSPYTRSDLTTKRRGNYQ